MKSGNLKGALAGFSFSGELTSASPYGNGHINDTYLLTFKISDMGNLNVILQRINKSVFSDPVRLMDNILKVTEHLRDKIIARGGDPLRETLNVIKAWDGKPYFKDLRDNFWRAYVFITDATSYDQPESINDFYESGKAFGNFQKLLSDFPAAELYETIPAFHDTRARFKAFKAAVEADICNRASSVRDEIEFILSREHIANYFSELLDSNQISLRVTHNDTKLNNIMIDNKTHKGICVIDLDTVMPGLVMNDFGDSIRFGASTAAEDERDLSKVSLDIEMFKAYTKGFLEGCDGTLTKKEIELLPMGALVMTFECGIRFLTDFLQGDTYFKTHREGHNLDRTRTQLKLVSDMENKWELMKEIVTKYAH